MKIEIPDPHPDPDPWARGMDTQIRIPDPDFYSSQKQQQKRWKKISRHTFLCSHKFHKIVNYFSFEVLKKKFGAILKQFRTF